MSKAMADSPALRHAREYHGFDRIWDTDPDTTFDWIKTGEGTAVITDGGGNGLLLTPSAGTIDNDEVYLDREFETFKPANNTPSSCETMLSYAQAATNAGNLVVGFTDAVAANLLVDDGAGPKTSGSFALFYSKDGGLNWWVGISVGSTQTLVELTAANSLDKQAHEAGSSSNQILRIDLMPKAGSLCDVAFIIDGVTVRKFMDWDISSITDMQYVVGAKNGSTADETPTIFYSSAWQKR